MSSYKLDNTSSDSKTAGNDDCSVQNISTPQEFDKTGEKIFNTVSGFKYSRVLQIYTRLINGEVIIKSEESKRFGVASRSIQRDIDDLRSFFSDREKAGEEKRELIYDQRLGGYYLVSKDEKRLTNSELLTICKILLDTHALSREDMESIIRKLINGYASKNVCKPVKEFIDEELDHYIEFNHIKNYSYRIRMLSEAIYTGKVTQIKYILSDKRIVTRNVIPAGIMFCECHFYLVAFEDETNSENTGITHPMVYRVDHISDVEITNRYCEPCHNNIPDESFLHKCVSSDNSDKFIHFMFLKRDFDLQSILDKLPEARVISCGKGVYLVTSDNCALMEEWINDHSELI